VILNSFGHVVLGLYIVSVCEHVKFGKKKITSTNGAENKILGSAFYVDKQLNMLLFVRR